MNALAGAVVASAALVWLGGWVSLRAALALDAPSVPPRLRGRVAWWAGHRTLVGTVCGVLAGGGLTVGLLVG